MGETTGTRSSTWWTRQPRHPHADAEIVAPVAPAYPAGCVCVCAAVLGVVIVKIFAEVQSRLYQLHKKKHILVTYRSYICYVFPCIPLKLCHVMFCQTRRHNLED